jgi:hypothetical protein
MGPVPKTMFWISSGWSGSTGDNVGVLAGDGLVDGIVAVSRLCGRLSLENGVRIWFVLTLYIAKVNLRRRSSTRWSVIISKQPRTKYKDFTYRSYWNPAL